MLVDAAAVWLDVLKTELRVRPFYDYSFAAKGRRVLLVLQCVSASF